MLTNKVGSSVFLIFIAKRGVGLDVLGTKNRISRTSTFQPMSNESE